MFRPILVLLLLAACDAPTADCEAATQHVSDCYGAEVAETFAASCTPESAATALDEACTSPEEGKEDSGTTDILSPAVEHFKYGSIGADKLGLPLALMRAIPLVCADTLPPGADPRHEPLAAFGLIYEPGHALPIGFSQRKLPLIGMTLVGNTCSVCHTSTIRETVSSERSAVYFGAPNIKFDIERYNNYLLGCIGDSTRFNATSLNAAFDELGITGWERLLAYKTSFIRAFVSNTQRQVASIVRDGPWGPGRDDALGLSAAILLGEEFVPPVPGPVDFPSVWNQAARHGHALHWDGAAGSALERNVLVAVGAGTPNNGVPIASLGAIQSWLDQLPAPRYPFAIDQSKLARGAQVFADRCDSCHGATGARTWSVIPIEELGTDRNRMDSATLDGIAKLNTLRGTGWAFSHFTKTDGYLTSILDGVWLRAPYLHNGSVPTLRDLLKPAAQRPRTFYRGNDTYDQAAVGFASSVASEGATQYTLVDTARAGNSASGHEYGTDLSTEDQDALLEYLKTL